MARTSKGKKNSGDMPAGVPPKSRDEVPPGATKRAMNEIPMRGEGPPPSDLGDRPWLVLLTRRDQQRGFVPRGDGPVTSLQPAPLDPAAALELVQLALEEHPLPAQALAALAERGGGNPMFLEALVRDAGRSGSVADLPESVEGLVTSQIDVDLGPGTLG